MATAFFLLCLLPYAFSQSAQLCKDNSAASSCVYWKGLQFCSSSSQYYDFMKKQCSLTCGFCQVSACDDNPQYKLNCPDWAFANYCKQGAYVGFMQQNCKRSCGLCGSTVSTTAPPVTTAGPPTSEFPCAFETDLCEWVNEPLEDAADWSVGTDSNGPSSGAEGSSNYAFVDSSHSGSKARLLLPFELALPSGSTNKGPNCLKFQYVLSGGSLRVIENLYATINDKSPVERTMVGLSSASSWTQAKVQVTVDDRRQIIIEGIHGGSGAIAIDELVFVSGQC